MGKMVKSVGSVFGIGPEGEHYNPERSASDQYRKWADKTDDSVDGIKGTRMATDEIRSNPMLSGLFGQGGLQDRLATEEQDLASTGYGLTGADREAYGQASGDITRQFAQQEQDAAKALAKRGLGGGASGAAGATFSGIAGNKNEMLAKAQTDIAQKRMADTRQRLNDTRQMMGSLGTQAGQQIGAQFGRQMDSRSARGNELLQAANNEKGLNSQLQAAVEDKRGSRAKNLGDAWAEGTYSGTRSGTADSTASWAKMGSAPSMGGGGGGGGGGMMSMFSDERLKQPAGSDPRKGGFDADFAEREKSGGGGSGGGVESKFPWSGMMGGDEAGGGGAMGMNPNAGGMSIPTSFSDEDSKMGVEDGRKSVRGFLDSIQPHEYEYKPEVKGSLFGGEGTYVSPMAQELEQTELGAEMVEDTPEGKMVDYGKGFGTLTAGLADVHSRLKRLEGGR